MVFVLQNPKVKQQRFEKLKMYSHYFNEFTVLYNGYGKNQFLYFSVCLGSYSMFKDGFLLIIPFLVRSGVTDPYRDQIFNLISWIYCLASKFKSLWDSTFKKTHDMDYFKNCFIYSEALVIAVLHKILKNSKNN